MLDDILLDLCQKAIINTPQDVTDLAEIIFSKCTDYWKSKLHPDMTNAEVVAVCDRTFMLFDNFVRMALKSSDFKVRIMGETFQKYTYKMQFMSHPELKKVYEDLNNKIKRK